MSLPICNRMQIAFSILLSRNAEVVAVERVWRAMKMVASSGMRRSIHADMFKRWMCFLVLIHCNWAVLHTISATIPPQNCAYLPTHYQAPLAI